MDIQESATFVSADRYFLQILEESTKFLNVKIMLKYDVILTKALEVLGITFLITL
jgi:hypothetical protein